MDKTTPTDLTDGVSVSESPNGSATSYADLLVTLDAALAGPNEQDYNVLATPTEEPGVWELNFVRIVVNEDGEEVGKTHLLGPLYCSCEGAVDLATVINDESNFGFCQLDFLTTPEEVESLLEDALTAFENAGYVE